MFCIYKREFHSVYDVNFYKPLNQMVYNHVDLVLMHIFRVRLLVISYDVIVAVILEIEKKR